VTDSRSREHPLGVDSSVAMAQTTRGQPTLAELYEAHSGFVWRVVRRFGIDDAVAEDVVHEVFIVARRKLPEFEGRSSVATWLFGIARGVCANERRSQARTRRRLELVPRPEPSSSPEDAMRREDTRALVRAFLDTLPESQRRVFELGDIEGLSGPEMAVMLECPLNSVYSRQRLARKRFHAFLRERGLIEGKVSP
jgi:RNA polymerase sigma-70 factor (ECF subfamily)